MKHFKILGLLAIAAAATMAFAASASADYVSTTTGGPASTPTIHAVNEGGHVILQNSIANISCSSTIEGNVVSHGAGENVGSSIGTFSFTGCTNGWHVTTITGGSLSIESTGGHNGTLVSTGLWFEATRFGITCIYETIDAHLGTITGGNPATVHVEGSVELFISGSSGLCGVFIAELRGNYVTTSSLYVANS